MATAYIDANVFIYATAPRPEVSNCDLVLEVAAEQFGTCITSAETLQEVLHVLGRQNALTRVRDALALAVGAAEIEPLGARDVLRAAEFDFPPRMSARDRVHFAVMERLRVSLVISADADFDALPGVTRLDPADFETWRELVFGQ